MKFPTSRHPLISEVLADAAEPGRIEQRPINHIEFGTDAAALEQRGYVAASFDSYAMAAGMNRRSRRRIKAIYRARGMA